MLEQQNALGDPRLLARPWDPATCVDPQLRAEIWRWLEQVVTWLNHEYVWDADAMIPSCWPSHPHLVHELAVLADLRRRAGLGLTADGLEEWHRYALPAFADRMRQRMSQHCQEAGHQAWPAKSRHARHTAEAAVQERAAVQHADLGTLTAPAAMSPTPVWHGRSTQPQLQIIDGPGPDLET
ncbi:hypothetical protein [Cellulomonas sp. P24]|nr:hypothetical protein [Cellulomonas sp. P24]MCR6490883.1 hypothetical protein [Cellulomonas sp. P24]